MGLVYPTKWIVQLSQVTDFRTKHYRYEVLGQNSGISYQSKPIYADDHTLGCRWNADTLPH
jgi:Asp-tRNA(Asn)/Glu-tRNA(Gln) amidotransferase B subunit